MLDNLNFPFRYLMNILRNINILKMNIDGISVVSKIFDIFDKFHKILSIIIIIIVAYM